MHLFFSEKVVVITGGSEGIGRALIDILIRSNAMVATCGRHEEKLLQLKKEIVSDRLLTVVADVSKKKDCQDFIKTVIQQFKKIDILINNAGVSMRSEFIDTDIAVFQKIMDTNFSGTVITTKLALPYLIATQGIIVGISSIAGYRATPGRSAYAASKFAINGFFESLRLELKRFKVAVILIAPGFISSKIRFNALDGNGNLVNETTLEEKKMMTPELCATHIIQAIMNKKAMTKLSFMGKLIVWVNKFFPKYADHLVYRHYYDNNKLIK